MTTVVRQTGLAPVQAPLPIPRQFGLFAAARLTQDGDERWLRGAFVGGDFPGPAFTFDPCSSGTDRVKAEAGTIANPMVGSFMVYLPGFCTAQGIGPDSGFFTDRLELLLQAYEEAAVERVLVGGDGLAIGSFLGDDNMTVLGSGAQKPLRALELLEAEIGRVGGGGILHAAPQVATAWDSLGVTENRGGVKRTMLGTPIAVGDGYLGADPEMGSTPSAGQEWAFASGPIEVLRTADIITIPGSYAQALDRAMNDVLFFAERPYLINWIARQDSNDDDHVQAGVLVDLT